MNERSDRPRYVTIGTITSPRGTRGEVNVYPHTDRPERFEGLGKVLLGNGGTPRPGGSRRVECARVAQRSIVLKLEDVNDRDAAEHLRGVDLLVPMEETWQLPEGHYYHFDLVGLAVIDPAGRPCGRLVRIYDGPGNDFYAVAKEEAAVPSCAASSGAKKGGKRPAETLVPAVRHVVLDVNLKAGTITVDWPELRGEDPVDAH